MIKFHSRGHKILPVLNVPLMIIVWADFPLINLFTCNLFYRSFFDVLKFDNIIKCSFNFQKCAQKRFVSLKSMLNSLNELEKENLLSVNAP